MTPIAALCAVFEEAFELLAFKARFEEKGQVVRHEIEIRFSRGRTMIHYGAHSTEFLMQMARGDEQTKAYILNNVNRQMEELRTGRIAAARQGSGVLPE